MTSVANAMLRLRPMLVAATALVLAAGMPARAEGTVVAGKYGNWTLHVNEGKGYKICFITAEPSAKMPTSANRAAVLLYVSAWPKDGVKSEVSVKLGYTIKGGSEVKVATDKERFSLFPKDERAYVAEPTQELKLIEAMKKGSKLTVEAKSDRGAGTTDTYSLTGFTQAIQALSSNCP